MEPGVYKIQNHYKGDTFDGLDFTLVDSDTNNGINLCNTFIRVIFRKSNKIGQEIVQKELSTSNSGVSIIDCLNGKFRFNKFLIAWEAGQYHYDVEITFPDGSIKTYLKGSILIIQDVTYG